MTHAREDELGSCEAWLASTVVEEPVKETHWFSKLCRVRPGDVVRQRENKVSVFLLWETCVIFHQETEACWRTC